MSEWIVMEKRKVQQQEEKEFQEEFQWDCLMAVIFMHLY